MGSNNNNSSCGSNFPFISLGKIRLGMDSVRYRTGELILFVRSRRKYLSLRSVSPLHLLHFALAILAAVVLSGCNSGGGGEGDSSAGNNPPAGSSTTASAVIGASGGSVSLSDGTMVVIDAGIVQDGTTITVTSEPAPDPTSPGITPISAIIKVTIPAGSLLQSPASGVDGISVQIPVTSRPSAVSAFVAVASQSGLVSTSYRYVKAALKTGTNQIAYYGRLAADATVATGKLTYNTISNFGQAVGDQYLKGIQLIAEFNAELIQPNVSTAGQLFEVRDGSLSDGSFVESLSPTHSNVPTDKLPLVMVHGIILGCDGGAEAYKKTWEEFIKLFYSEEHQISSDLRNKYQLYTFSYQTDLGVNGNGELLASTLQATFGQRSVQVLAHSMGGLVARSAMVQHGANIGGVITLGTPHHGTVIAEGIAAVVDKLACIFATDAQGALDLQWDSFNNPSLGCTNEFLCGPSGLNTVDQNQSKYITYAGELGNNPLACSNPIGIVTNFLDSLLLCNQGLILTTLGPVIGFGNDGIVPKQSASFAEYDSSALSNFFMRDNPQLRRSPRVFSGTQHISIHDSHLIFHGDKDNHLIYATPNVAQDLLDFYDSLTPPTVNTTSITNGATDVAVNSAISVTFSEVLDVSTITTSTFTLSGPSGLVAGTVTFNTATNTATFTPSTALAYNTTYTATITTGVKDLMGNPLASNYSWGFTTVAATNMFPSGLPIERVSITSDGVQADGGHSGVPSISSDGRFVAFESSANNLVLGDTNNLQDIFVHDRQTGVTARMSVASDGTQANGMSYTPSISGDGRFVAFRSQSSNLVTGDTNGEADIFVHDRLTGQTTRVSVASDGTQSEANRDNGAPSISADGRYVAFSSEASNLVPEDVNLLPWLDDIFVHDRQTGQTTRVSNASDGTQGDDRSKGASISADGRYVAYYSDASNLVTGDTNGRPDIFVNDRQTAQTTRVNVASDGTEANTTIYTGISWPSISADGRYVAFRSLSSNLVPGDTNGGPDVFVHDRQTGQTTRVSVASDGTQANVNLFSDFSSLPSISGDGRYVAFNSAASNLVAGDTNNRYDIFVHDRLIGLTTRVSVASDGAEGNSDSINLCISSDGHYVAFDSGASNLVTGDTNGLGVSDVFVAPVPLPPQCSDDIDNDGDGKIDLADPGCSSAQDNSEFNISFGEF